jgi:hypothetical protein
MEAIMRVISIKDSSMERDSTDGVMGRHLMVNGATIILKAMEHTVGLMDADTSANGKRISCMDRVDIPGKTAEVMKVNM